MKRILFLLGILLVPVTLSAQDALPVEKQYEHILHYHSDIYIRKNCHVKVVETIQVYAAGIQILRGIYRELPTSYAYKGGNVNVGFKLLGVKRDGKKEQYHTEDMDNGIRIYAGDPDYYVPVGVHTYEFSYEVDHVLGYFDKYDELYWNVNGNGWQFDMDSVTANVYLPEGAKLVQYTGYTGKYGIAGTSFRTKEISGGIHYTVTRQLTDHENLTVSVAWDKNHLKYPTAFENFIYWLMSYSLWIICGLGLLTSFLLNFRMWYKYGRDPKPGTIIPLFYPPTGFSPAECVYLKKGGYKSNTMFGSMLVSLAVKGMIKIELDAGKGLLAKRKYTIHNLYVEEADAKKPLTELESHFYKRLLGGRSTETIQQSTYNPRIQSANKNLIEKIDSKQKNVYFKRNNHLNAKQYLVTAAVGVAGGLAYAFLGGSLAILISAVVIMIGMNVIFGFLYEQPTAEGRKKMDEIAGFEMYMKYADRERIRLQNPPTMNFDHYEDNLAYAIALGVAKEWAGQFDPVELQEHFQHHMPFMAGMMMADFYNLGSDLSQTVSSAATPPSSSGSTSGGGGFSGGGGGGGGGGGW